MKAPIRVYDTNNGTALTLVSWIDDYESCIFKRHRSEIGTFSIQINGRIPKAVEFQEGRIIWVGSVKSRVGLITSVNKTKEGNRETWTISGVEAKGISAWRNIYYTGFSHYTVNDDAETVIKSAFTRFFGSGAESNRQVSLINIPASAGSGSTYLLNERFSQLSDALQSCSESTGQWWRLEINTDTGKLDVYATAPTDRTVNQSVNSRAPFSEKFLTVQSMDYIDDTSEYYNVAIVAGQGEDTARTVVTVGTATGWARREAFYDARDLSDSGSLTSRGTSELAAIAETVGIDITAMTKSQLKPDVDYYVGDLVTVSAFGIEQDKPITEISESWSQNGYEVDITFGLAVSTRKKDIKDVKASTQKAVSV